MIKLAKLIGVNFGAIYLTIMSLLQGIVISLLVPSFLQYFDMAPHPFTDIHIVPYLIMLQIIFTVWHHYAMGVFYLRWFPNLIDTFIPFMISILQFTMVSFLEIEDSVSGIALDKWIISFGVFMLLGCFAYFAAYVRLNPEYFTNMMALENAKAHVRRNGRFHFWAGVSILIQGLFALLIALADQPNLLYISLVLFMLHILVSEYVFIYVIRPPFAKAMGEYDQVDI